MSFSNVKVMMAMANAPTTYPAIILGPTFILFKTPTSSSSRMLFSRCLDYGANVSRISAFPSEAMIPLLVCYSTPPRM